MLAEFSISDKDIAFAEQVLLPERKLFDDERRNFIRRLDTLDLQAVPGSGKTTALLAKLIILERYLPFDDGAAVLVISHTHAAVDEIRKKIGDHCPRLFSYPNYVGTIQGFVDRFLAIPYFVSRRNKRPIRIDNQIYAEAIERSIRISLPNFNADEQKSGRHYLIASKKKMTYRLYLERGIARLAADQGGSELIISKPKGNTRPGNYSDWSDHEKSRVKSWLKEFKLRIVRDGILCFDDAYFLAACCLSRFPQSQALIQRRFRYVFVDEMQDMGKHQYDLLEQLFFDDGKSPCGYQRIGDRNQSIHDRDDFDVESVWRDRVPVLALANSCRLSPPVARIVEAFAVHRDSKFCINGLGGIDIKPRLVIYDNNSRKGVLRWFSALLSDLIRTGKIPHGTDTTFNAVAWNSEWPQVGHGEATDEGDKSNGGQSAVRMVDYLSSFRRVKEKTAVDHDCLESYLRFFDRKVQTLQPAQTSILSAFLKVMRIEDLKNPSNGRHFTTDSLLKYLRDNFPNIYEEFRLSLYHWSLAAIKRETTSTLAQIIESVERLLRIFGKRIGSSEAFLHQRSSTARLDDKINSDEFSNKVNFDDFDIELATVHSVKGRTHTATLYLDTFFHGSCESQRLCNQLLLKPLNGDEGKRVKQSAKMVYVGFSRPTHLLCFAAHKNSLSQYLTEVDTTAWEIVRLDPLDQAH
jgi:ATP-dependent DNA helicase UvrD/PcrA